jgi:putative Holliday junction resolvase
MGRILGIDFGEKRLGLALSDESHTLASPLAVYERKDLPEDIKFLSKLVAQHKITEIVLGLPINMNGSLGEKAQQVLEFKRLLEEHLKIAVSTFDERLTTAEAERAMREADLSRRKRKQRRDALAAVLILQGYLNCKGERPFAPT